MVIATVAAYIISIVAIIGLSVRFLWLFFILFTYRTIASILPYEWLKSIGLESHTVYFVIVLTISIGIYYLVIRFTQDLPWIKFVLLILMLIWVLKTYSLQDIFFFKDFLQARGMWDIHWYINQIKELFHTNSEEYSNLFTSAFNNVWNVFKSLFSGLSSSAK